MITIGVYIKGRRRFGINMFYVIPISAAGALVAWTTFGINLAYVVPILAVVTLAIWWKIA